jgi:hypothetical protein
MRNYVRVLAVLVCAPVFVAVVAGTAFGRRIEVNNQGFRIAWRSLRFFSGEGTPDLTCPVTMEGSFHSRTISKVSGQLVGYITRVTVAPQTEPPCTYTNGASRLVILNEMLPWHLRFDSFTGTLPAIRTLKWQIIGAGFSITTPFGPCLYKSTTARPLDFYFFLTETEGRGTSIPLSIGGGCPEFETVEGIDTLTVLNSTAALALRLVQ